LGKTREDENDEKLLKVWSPSAKKKKKKWGGDVTGKQHKGGWPVMWLAFKKLTVKKNKLGIVKEGCSIIKRIS